MGAANVRVGLGDDDTAVLVTLVIILRVACLLSTFKSEADPGEVCCFLPLAPDPQAKDNEKIFFNTY